MAPQHDFILDNQNGAQFRADVNLALEAIATVSSGAVEPTTTYAYQYWADTTTGYLKQRDASNANWIVRGNLAADYGQAGQVLTSAGAGVPAIWTSITEDGAWTVAQDSTNAHFTFTGNGFDGTETNPDIYLVRGAVYNFTNASTTKGFQIQSTAGLSGTAYSDGITNNPALAPDSSTTETLVWTVQMDAPSELYYHSTVDAGPGGNIYILDEAGGGALEWTLTANGTTDYIFAGPGFAGTETDPDLYVVRGQTYKFTNSMGAHPFQIQSTQGTSGTAYNDGITNNAVSNGTLTWEVRMDAPSTLYYQCTAHADMNGTIYVLDEGSSVASIDDLGDVDTTTVAPTDGQALVWDAANSQWEPGTVSGGGGTSLPAAQDGEALIYENGQWVAGPVIGGVDYTPSGDANFSSVELLLLGNGTNGSTTFTDSSSNSLSLTSTNVAISTAQYKFGGSSIYVTQVSAEILTSSISAFALGTDDFTIECWYRPVSRVSGHGRIWSLGSSLWNSNDVLVFNDRHNDNPTNFILWIHAFSSTSPILVSTTTVTDGTWYHLAVVRDGNTFRLFVDGVEEDTYTSSGAVTASSTVPFRLGNPSGSERLDGFIDDLRVTKGVARYTAAFTPPTAELPTTGGAATTIPYSIDKLDDVDTSTVAPTDGQALLWDNTAQKWEPGTVSGGGGTTLPSGTTDGEALIWENGAWAVGPAIGGVDYTQGSTLSSNYTAPTGFNYWVDTFALRDPSNATLSNNDLTATCGSAQTQAYSNSSKSSGLWYWEISIDGGTDTHAWIGIAPNTNNWVGSSESDGIGINGSGQIANNTGGTTISSVSTHAAGDIRMFALDANSKKLWIGKNGTWENSGDPAAGTGAVLENWTGTPDWLFICRLENPNSGWGNTIQVTGSSGTQVTIPYSIDKLDDVDTSTVAPTDGQALLWDNTAQKWEPGTVSGGGTSLPTAQDGEALIYENGQWVAGPVIGGVNYSSSASSTYTVPSGFASWGDTWTTDTGCSYITFSNNDLTATASTNGSCQAFSSTTKSTGKWYWEISLGTVTSDTMLGITVNTNSFPGAGGTGGLGLYHNGTWFNDSGATVTNVSSLSTNDVVMFALDADAKKLWVGLNGTWENSGDPAAGTGEVVSAWTSSPNWKFVARMFTAGFEYTIENTGGATTTILASDSIRTLLGIDEYADDTAAGTGGVASGALYYNTTSSDYRLKS